MIEFNPIAKDGTFIEAPPEVLATFDDLHLTLYANLKLAVADSIDADAYLANGERLVTELQDQLTELEALSRKHFPQSTRADAASNARVALVKDMIASNAR
jgi:hypothetical protein